LMPKMRLHPALTATAVRRTARNFMPGVIEAQSSPPGQPGPPLRSLLTVTFNSDKALCCP
jgi:hypothetical protein